MGNIKMSYGKIFLASLLVFILPCTVLADTYTSNSGTDYIDTAFAYAPGPYYRYAEAITLSSSGTLTEISVCVNNVGGTSVPVQVEIYDRPSSAAPTGSPIALSGAHSMPSGSNYGTFSFSSEAVTASDYWVVLTTTTLGGGDFLRPCGSSSGTTNYTEIGTTWYSNLSGGGTEGLTLTYSSGGGGDSGGDVSVPGPITPIRFEVFQDISFVLSLSLFMYLTIRLVVWFIRRVLRGGVRNRR